MADRDRSKSSRVSTTAASLAIGTPATFFFFFVFFSPPAKTWVERRDIAEGMAPAKRTAQCRTHAPEIEAGRGAQAQGGEADIHALAAREQSRRTAPCSGGTIVVLRLT